MLETNQKVKEVTEVKEDKKQSKFVEHPEYVLCPITQSTIYSTQL